MAVVIALSLLGSFLFIGVLVQTLYKKSHFRIRLYVSRLPSTARLSADDLKLLALHFPDYRFDPKLYDVSGLFYYHYQITGSYQGHTIKDYSYFIDDLAVSYFGPPVFKTFLDAHLKQRGHFQIAVYRDSSLLTTRVAIVSAFGQSAFTHWMAEQRNNPLYTGIPAPLDNAGTRLIEKRPATAAELAVMRSLIAVSYRGWQGVLLAIALALVIMSAMFVLVTKQYQYIYWPGAALGIMTLVILTMKPRYNAAHDFINMVRGDVVYDEQRQTYRLGELDIHFLSDSLAAKYQGQKNVSAALATLEPPHCVIAMNGEMIARKKNYDRLQMLLMMYALFGAFFGFFAWIFN